MKSLILLLALCVSPAGAASAIAVVTNCTPNAGTSCTLLATPPFGSLMVSMAIRASATAPTTASGWTVIKSTTGNTNSVKTAWKYSVGTETTCGTWANASATFCQVYSGNWNGSTGPIGTATGGTTGASTTISYTGFTLNVASGASSWVACAGGAGSATAGFDTAPSGLTLRSGTTLATLAYSDTNGGVNTYTTQTVGFTTSSNWASACFEILSAPPLTSPTGLLVAARHYSQTSEACTGACDLTLDLPATTLSNNLMTVAWSWQYASVAPTVSNIYCNADTGHATWTFSSAGHNVLNTTDLNDSFAYYIAGAASGCNTVTIVASSVWTDANAEWQEWSGIATTTPLDTGSGQISSGTTPIASAASITPGTSGDLIWLYCAYSSNGLGSSAGTNVYAPGLYSLGTDMEYGLAGYAAIQTTAAAIVPAIDFVGTGAGGDANCIALAFKTAAAGTVATGVHIVSQQDYTGAGVTTTVLQTHVFNTGDALIVTGLSTQGTNVKQWSGISDSISNSFTSHQPEDGNGGYPNWAIDCEATAGEDNITLTGTNASGNGNYVVLEVAGLKNSSHTACYDSTAGTPTGAGNTSPYSTAPSITPSTSGGLVLAAIQFGVGPSTAVSTPSGAVYAYPTYTGMTDGSSMTWGGGFSYLYSASTSAQSWTWTNAISSAWVASAIALEAAATGTKRLRGSVINR